MHNISRRSLIAYGLVSAQGMLAACGGSDGGNEATAATPPAPPAPGTAAPAAAPAPTWNVGPALRLVADETSRFDLSTTLPAGVRPGGVFKLAAGSAALPAGVTLTAGGILQASASAGIGSISGLLFSYDEP